MKVVKNFCILLFLVPLSLYSEGKEKKADDYTTKGMTAYSQGDYKLAIEMFVKAHESKPEYSAITYNIACCYALQGNKDSAYTWLEKTIDLGAYKFADDKDFESLYKDDEFKALVTEADQKIELLKEKEWKPVIVVPDEDKSEQHYPVIIALHGFGGNPVNFSTTLGDASRKLGWLLCCPYGPEIRGTTAFGWGEMEVAENRVLESIAYLKDNFSVDTTKILLLGYSQGGSRSIYTWFKNPELFQGLITVASYYDKDLYELYDPAQHNSTRIYMIIGEKDRNLENNQQAKKLFQENGLGVNLVVYPDLGHAFPPDTKQVLSDAVDWIEKNPDNNIDK